MSAELDLSRNEMARCGCCLLNSCDQVHVLIQVTMGASFVSFTVAVLAVAAPSLCLAHPWLARAAMVDSSRIRCAHCRGAAKELLACVDLRFVYTNYRSRQVPFAKR